MESDQPAPSVRRAHTARTKMAAAPSVRMGQTFAALLVAPWFFALLLSLLHVHPISNFWTLRAIEWTALLIFTCVSIVIVSGLVSRARDYEATRDGERLLFSNARDAMLLLRVHRETRVDEGVISYSVVSENGDE